MMLRRTLFLLFMGLSSSAGLLAQKFPAIRYEDKTYETTIKTVGIYPAPNQLQDPARTTYPPIISLEANNPLIAEFDDLTARFRSFRYKVFHCNADWTPSNLNDIEFTYEYNDYAVNTYQASFNTKIPYFHYTLEVPKLKLSGNYVLAVYEDTRPAKLVLTRRFMMYQPRVSIFPQVRLSTGIREQRTHQQIEFDLEYRGYEILSPAEDLKIVIRQNFRWDKTITGLRPTNVRIFDQRLEYRPFDLSNNILAGNEFRWFDTRLSRASGMSVSEVQQLPDQTIAHLRPRRVALGWWSDFSGTGLKRPIHGVESGCRQQYQRSRLHQCRFYAAKSAVSQRAGVRRRCLQSLAARRRQPHDLQHGAQRLRSKYLYQAGRSQLLLLRGAERRKSG